MAYKYVWSGATGANDGSSWANAWVAISSASFMLSSNGGDILCVAHDHSELVTSATINQYIKVENPNRVMCFNRLGSVPPVEADRRATAVVATTTGTIAIQNPLFFDGIILIAGNTTSSTAIQIGSGPGHYRFDNCSLRIGSTHVNSRIQVSAAALYNAVFCELNNTTVSFGLVNQGFDIKGALHWRNTPNAVLATGVIPTFLFTPVVNGAWISCIGVDFTAMGAGKTILSSTVGCGIQAKFRDCKFDPTVTLQDVPVSNGAADAEFIRCSPTVQNYSLSVQRYSGILTHETGFVRSGGASDGTTPISWKVVQTANTHHLTSFDTPQIAIWNAVVGAPITATIECVYSGDVLPTNDQIWIEVEYLGDGSTMMGSFVNDGKASSMSTATPQTASAATWPPIGPLTTYLHQSTATAQVLLTNNNLTTTHIGTNFYEGVRSIDYRSSGKYHFEMTCGTVTAGMGNAIALASASFGNIVNGSTGAATIASSGLLWINGVSAGFTLGALGVGNVVSFAVDLDAHLMWVRRNNGPWNNNVSAAPASGIGGATLPAGSYAFCIGFGPSTDGNSTTMNFGATSYVYAAPGGFGNWGGGSTPFKLETTFVPQQKGWVYARVKCAKPLATFYIDPKIKLA